VPLLPTTPFVLLSAFCFSRGCVRCENWLLAHPRLGPLVRDWRAERAVPLRAKQWASVMMVFGCVVAWLHLPAPWAMDFGTDVRRGGRMAMEPADAAGGRR